MAKCLVCNTNHIEMINIFRNREKLSSMLMLHWGLKATKNDYICRGCCDEVLREFDLNPTCQQPNQHNPEVLVNDPPILDPTNSVVPPEGSILPMDIKVESDSESVNELKIKPDILRLSVETNKIGGYVENTSKGFTDEFSIKIENFDATSEEKDDNNIEGNSVKTEMQFDNEDSDESGMGSVRSANVESNQRSFSGERPYKCPFCPKSFITLTRLKEHKRTHTGERPFACNSCSKTYITAGSLHIHIRTHMKEKPFVCSECGKSCTTSQLLKYHKRTHTGERPYACTYCSKSYITNSRLQRHMFSHRKEERKTKGPYECLECSKTFKSSWALKVHNRVHSQITNAFDSTQSSHQSNNKKEEVLLARMHTKEKPFSCLECGKSFLTTTKLQIHKRSHTGERPYKCNICLKSFVSSYKLTEHKRIHTGDKPYECRFCPKTFLRSTEVQGHERTHTKEKPYICSECGKGFVTSSVLNRHKRIHIGVKPYVCSYCSKSFTSKFYLKTHIRYHTKENLFECSDCGKSFTTSKLFQDHKMTHTGERPYSCTHCKKTYLNRSGLINHMRSQMKDERKRKSPYECLQCFKAFRNSCVYKVHVLMHSKQGNSSDSEETSNQSNTHTEKDLIASSRQNAEGISEGSRQYVCGCCSNNFNSGRDLRIHVREHKMEEMPQIGIETYACQFCPKTYIHVGHMRKHMKEKHNAEKDL